MEEDKPVVAEIQPLRWPERCFSKGVASLNPKNWRWRMIYKFDNEVAARPPIPPDVWGPDPRRQRMGSFISGLIEDRCGWLTKQFVPGDALNVLFYPRSVPDDSYEEVIDEIEKEIGGPFYSDQWTGFPNSPTLGDLVDYSLSRASNWPIDKWSPDPTGEICPTFSAFYDIRRFICSKYAIDRELITPSSPLSVFQFKGEDWKDLKRYLEKRFGARGMLFDRFLGEYPCCPFTLLYWVIFSILLSLFFHVSTLWGLIWIILISLIPAGLVVGSYSWGVWRKGLHTFRDLVEYVVEESKAKTPVG